MRELGRVLRPGGIAGFSEPGRHHSKGARSQYEMKNYTAIENDVVMEDVWRWRARGLSEVETRRLRTESHRRCLRGIRGADARGRALGRYAERVRCSARTSDVLPSQGRTGHEGQRERRRAERRDHRPAGAHGGARRRADSWNRHRAECRQRELACGIDAGGRRQSRRAPAQRATAGPSRFDFARVTLAAVTARGARAGVEFALAPPEPGDTC